MNINARANQILKIMQKNEQHQDFNRLLFLITLGIAFHSLTCIGGQKRLHMVDYVGLPVLALSAKRAHTLNKKNDKGLKVWQTLQHKSALKGA